MEPDYDGKLMGDQYIAGSVAIRGLIVGSVSVGASGELTLHGTITKDLVVEPGGTAIPHGTVVGSVRNNGRTKLYGVVKGRLISGPSGDTWRDKKSVVEEE